MRTKWVLFWDLEKLRLTDKSTLSLGMNRNTLAFRSVMDVLYLESKDVLVELKTAPNAIKHFYSLLSLYYDNYITYNSLKKLLYKWQLQSRIFYNLNCLFRNLIIFISFGVSRSGLFLKSKTYRQRVKTNKSLLIHRIFNLRQVLRRK